MNESVALSDTNMDFTFGLRRSRLLDCIYGNSSRT